MKKCIIYWSATGNTQAMASFILNGITENGEEVDIFNVSEISPKKAAEYDVLLLGCPAMGAEVLEESEFEPFYNELKSLIKGKTLGLFGSFDWGDGEWMRNWEVDAKANGANVLCTLIVNMNDIGTIECMEFGRRFKF